MNELESRLRDLREQYLKKLPERVAELRTSYQAWLSSSNSDDLSGLTYGAHSLAGSGSTFGLQSVSSTAMLLERLADSIRDPSSRVLNEHSLQLDTLIRELEEIAQNPQNYSQKMNLAQSSFVEVKQHNQLALVEDDQDYAEFLKQQLLPFGYQLHCFSNMAALLEGLRSFTPSVLLLDVFLKDSIPVAPQEIDQFLSICNNSIPILYISARDNLQTRMHAVNRGGAGFMGKPVNLDRLLERLDELSQSVIELPYRVLVMDDDPILAQHMKLVLESTNIKAQIVCQAEEFLKSIQEFDPELILMDLNLGEMDGIQLAKVIEQHERYFKLPIVFLSTENDLKKRLQAFAAGGENYLSKPVSSDMLLASVYTRVRRARQTSNRMRREGMTGLLTHAEIVEVFKKALEQIQIQNQPISIAFLDFDHFKAINDTYGHQAGDIVIRRFARLLKAAGFGRDLAGRYGGEEFLLLFPEMPVADALAIIEDLRDQLSCIDFYTADNELFHCSFSAGVAQADKNCSVQQLIEWADEALYEAKKRGRNQSRVYDPSQN